MDIRREVASLEDQYDKAPSTYVKEIVTAKIFALKWALGERGIP